MANRFNKKRVFITGASSGIGEALAKAFADEGAKVALAARRADRLRAVRNQIVESGGEAIACACDVTDAASIRRAVIRAVTVFGGIDVAVANAGFAVGGRFVKLSTEDFRRQFETNVFGVIDTVYAVLPHLRKTKGRLVIVSSIAGRIGYPAASAYCASKFAVCGLAEALYVELAELGVSVTCVLPGFVRTEIGKVDRYGKLRANRRDPLPSWLAASPESVAKEIVTAVARRQFEVVVTGHGKAIAAVGRYFPRLVRGAQRLGAKELIHQIDRAFRD